MGSEKLPPALAIPSGAPSQLEALLHYRLLEKLGAGGMGQVYLALDTKLDRKIALKLLPPHLAKKKESRDLFRREARAVAALNHPNIVTIHSVEKSGELHFLTMEVVDGETLDAFITPEGMELDRLLDIARTLVDAIAVAHERGIVHRDLKPKNIMIGKDGRLKVLDFGVAKMGGPLSESEESTSARTLTMEGKILGTLPYMSPEQLHGDTVSFASDVFSLGVILYEMATGQRPFRGETSADLIAAILRDPPCPLGELRQDIPVALNHIISLCLEKSLRQRYSSARHLFRALDDLGPNLKPNALATPARRQRHTVSRGAERQELHRGLEEVAQGQGLLLCVAGEPGIGKTTLVEDFLAELAADGPPCTLARGRCSERLAGTEAYLPLLEVMDDLLAGPRGDHVAAILRRTAPWWYLHATLPDEGPPEERVEQLSAATSPELMKRELAAFVRELCRPHPAVFFLDDLHWSDLSTMDLLAYLSSKFDETRLLIVATYRPEELTLSEHPLLQVRRDLEMRGRCREIRVRFLTREETAAYLNLEFPGHGFPAGIAELIHKKTEGNPLFIVDLVRDLRQRNVIVEEEGGYRLAQSMADLNLDLPPSVQSMIERKIQRLSDDDRRLLAAAGVEGYEFDSAVTSRVLDREAADIEERLQVLDRDHGFVQLVSEDELPDGTLTVRYRFVHVLYQNALTASLTPTRRVALNRATAEALLHHYGEDAGRVASDLAVLFEAARDFGRAIEFFSRAAHNSLEILAYQETIELANRGLALLERLPEEESRGHRETLESSLGSALIATQGYGSTEVQRVFARAHELCMKIGENPHLCRALQGLWMFWVVRAEYSRALDMAHRLARIADSTDDHVLQMQARFTTGFTYFYLGRFDASRGELERGVQLARPLPHSHYASIVGDDIRIHLNSFLSLALWAQGYPDQAKERIHQALSLAREVAHPYGLAYGLTAASWLHQLCGETEQVLDSAREVVGLASEHDIPYFLTTGNFMLSWSLAQGFEAGAAPATAGHDGIRSMRRSIEAYHATGSRMVETYLYALLGATCLRYDMNEEGRQAVTDGLDACRKTGEGSWEAELLRLQGVLLQRGGTTAAQEESSADAEDWLRKSLETARRQGARSLELRAALDLASLWRREHREPEARSLLEEVYSHFSEGFDTADLRRASAFLAGGEDRDAVS